MVLLSHIDIKGCVKKINCIGKMVLLEERDPQGTSCWKSGSVGELELYWKSGTVIEGFCRMSNCIGKVVLLEKRGLSGDKLLEEWQC